MEQRAHEHHHHEHAKQTHKPAPAAPVAPPKPGAKYTCPMHPQIVRDAPGSCPICGMALVPIAGTGEADDSELRDLTRDSGSGRRLPSRSCCSRWRRWSASWSRSGCAAHPRLGGVRSGHAGGVVGGLADPEEVLAVADALVAQHVHADRPWRRARLPLQPGRHFSARAVSRRSSGSTTARSVRTSRRRR